jgi:hypothetical protein
MQVHTHTHTHTESLTNSFHRNLAVWVQCEEEGVKGDLLIANAQITSYISMSFKDLHASLTIVKNILNWL